MITKEAQRTARQLFRYCLVNGRLDEDRARRVAKALADEKPRNYIQILKYFRKLVEMELSRHHVIIESAVELTQTQRDQILSGLGTRYGGGLTAEARINPRLLGGLKVRIGDDIYDGSVKGRLDRLKRAFS